VATRVFGVPQTPAWVGALLLVGGVARGDVVRMTDGRTITGTVAVEGQGLRVGGSVVSLDDVLDVTFDRRVRTAGQCCVLTDGTTLAGRVEGVDDRGVRIATPAIGELPVPIDRVARVQFASVSGELLGRIPTGESGLLLRDGDFFEGDLQRCDGATITMASPLLGEATFGTADRAAALVLRPAARTGGAWVVRTTDGSVLVTDAVTLVGGAVRADVAGVGAVAVRLSDVASLRAAGDRVVSLADVVPSGGTAVDDGTPVGLPPRLVGGAVERSVCVSAGTSVTYHLGGAYSAFACRAGVPAGVVPAVGVRWRVRVDGRVVADGGGPRTSVEDPVGVTVATAGVAELTLCADPAVAGGVVLFADPVLVRAGRPTAR
jgi:hypothetical protein